jgi:hypothetical protein
MTDGHVDMTMVSRQSLSSTTTRRVVATFFSLSLSHLRGGSGVGHLFGNQVVVGSDITATSSLSIEEPRSMGRPIANSAPTDTCDVGD